MVNGFVVLTHGMAVHAWMCVAGWGEGHGEWLYGGEPGGCWRGLACGVGVHQGVGVAWFEV